MALTSDRLADIRAKYGLDSAATIEAGGTLTPDTHQSILEKYTGPQAAPIPGGETPSTLENVLGYPAAFASGAIASTGQMLHGLNYLSNRFAGINIDLLQDGGNYLNELGVELMPQEVNFAHQVASGFGSLATFFIPGLTIAKGASVVAKVAPTMAKLLGVSLATVMESMAEAGGTWSQVLAQGGTQEEAINAGDRSFYSNLLLVGITNALGLKGIQKSKLLSVLGGSVSEGSQETVQEIIQRWALDEDISLQKNWQQYLTAFGVGGITGAAAKAILDRTDDAPRNPRTTEATPTDIAGDIEDVRQFFDGKGANTLAPNPVGVAEVERATPKEPQFVATLDPDRAIAKYIQETGYNEDQKAYEEAYNKLNAEYNTRRLGGESDIELTGLLRARDNALEALNDVKDRKLRNTLAIQFRGETLLNKEGFPVVAADNKSAGNIAVTEAAKTGKIWRVQKVEGHKNFVLTLVEEGRTLVRKDGKPYMPTAKRTAKQNAELAQRRYAQEGVKTELEKLDDGTYQLNVTGYTRKTAAAHAREVLDKVKAKEAKQPKPTPPEKTARESGVQGKVRKALPKPPPSAGTLTELKEKSTKLKRFLVTRKDLAGVRTSTEEETSKLVAETGDEVVRRTGLTDIKKIIDYYLKKWNITVPVEFGGYKDMHHYGVVHRAEDASGQVHKFKIELRAKDKGTRVAIGTIRHELEHIRDRIKEGYASVKGFQAAGHHKNFDIFERDYLVDGVARRALVADTVTTLREHSPGSSIKATIAETAKRIGISEDTVTRILEVNLGVKLSDLSERAPAIPPDIVQKIDRAIRSMKSQGTFVGLDAALTEMGIPADSFNEVKAALVNNLVNTAEQTPEAKANNTVRPKRPTTAKARQDKNKLAAQIKKAAASMGLLKRAEPSKGTIKTFRERTAFDVAEELGDKVGMTAEQILRDRSYDEVKRLAKEHGIPLTKSIEYENSGLNQLVARLFGDVQFDKLTTSQLLQLQHEMFNMQEYAPGDIVDHGFKASIVRTKDDLRRILRIPNMTMTQLRGVIGQRNPYRVLEQLGLEHFYTHMKEGKANGSRAAIQVWNEVTEKVNELRKEGGVSWRKVTEHAYWQQEDAIPTLEAQGIKRPTLTTQEEELYAYLQSTFKDLFGLIDQARAKAGLEPIGYVDNYFTFMRDFTTATKLGHDIMLHPSVKAIQNKLVQARQTYFGPEHNRVKSLRPLLTNGEEIVRRYITQAMGQIHVTPVISRLTDLISEYNLEPVGGSVVDANGKVHKGRYAIRYSNPEVHQWLTDWINYSAGRLAEDMREHHSWHKRVLRQVNRNIALSYIALNPSTILNQGAALLLTFARTSPVDWFHGMSQAAGLLMRDTFTGDLFRATRWTQGVRARSNVLVTRSFDAASRDIGNAPIRWLSPYVVTDLIRTVGVKLIGLSDEFTAIASWHAFANQAKRHGITDPKAIAQYADRWTVRTQASGAREDTAPIQRTDIGRTVTMLQTYVLNMYGFLTEDLLDTKKRIGQPRTAKSKIIAKAIYFSILAEAFGAAYERLFPWMLETLTGKDINLYSPVPTPITAAIKAAVDSGDSIETAKKGAFEMVEYLPFGSSFRYGSSPLGPTADLLGQLSGLAGGRPQVQENVELVARFAGLPVSAVKRLSKWYDSEPDEGGF